jgi:tagatose 6-phosphate kinase
MALAFLNPVEETEAVVNEVGPEVSAAEYEPFLEHLSGLLDGAEYLAISGSAPPGVPLCVYSEMVEMARRKGLRTAVDASGAALAEAVKARPYLVKPNRDEVRALGFEVAVWSDAAAVARDLRLRFGIDIVMITGGAEGAVVSAQSGAWSAAAPNVDVVSTLGSGDSAMAGFLWSLGENGDVEQALRMAVGCGAANAATAGAGRCSPDRIADLSGRIVANEI